MGSGMPPQKLERDFKNLSVLKCCILGVAWTGTNTPRKHRTAKENCEDRHCGKKRDVTDKNIAAPDGGCHCPGGGSPLCAGGKLHAAASSVLLGGHPAGNAGAAGAGLYGASRAACRAHVPAGDHPAGRSNSGFLHWVRVGTGGNAAGAALKQNFTG